MNALFLQLLFLPLNLPCDTEDQLPLCRLDSSFNINSKIDDLLFSADEKTGVFLSDGRLFYLNVNDKKVNAFDFAETIVAISGGKDPEAFLSLSDEGNLYQHSFLKRESTLILKTNKKYRRNFTKTAVNNSLDTLAIVSNDSEWHSHADAVDLKASKITHSFSLLKILPINAIFLSNDSLLIYGFSPNAAIVLNIKNGIINFADTIRAKKSIGTSAYSSESNKLYLGHLGSSSILVCNAKSHAIEGAISLPAPPSSIYMIHDYDILAVGFDANTYEDFSKICFISAKTFKIISSIKSHKTSTKIIRYLQKPGLLVTAGDSGEIGFWKIEKPKK